jgi:hypothetical protein
MMKDQRNQSFAQYAGLATQLFVSLAISIWIGKWADKKIITSAPVFAWLLPLLVLIVILIKIVKDTSTKK